MEKIWYNFVWFSTGCFLTLVFCGWKVGNGPVFEAKRQNDKLIAQCEQLLPRNQHCVLIAVVEDVDK